VVHLSNTERTAIDASTAKLAVDELASIDALLYRGLRIPGIAKVRELTGLGIHESAYLLMERFGLLVAQSPEKFTVPIDNYWDQLILG
jgi:hypothetical protein